MSQDQSDTERPDEWALADLDAAVGIVGATVGAAFGPLGSILGAFVGPYARPAVTRFMELRTRVAEEVDLDDEELRRRLEESEPLAQMIAEVVRRTVESDLEAKRRLLARAVIRALQDDAAVDEEAAFVRTANAIDTKAIRVLAILGEERRDAEGRSLPTQSIPLSEVFERWPGVQRVIGSVMLSLGGAGLVETGAWGNVTHDNHWRVSGYGQVFLGRLGEEGLGDELRRRDEA